jgi:hypothetical protein
MRDRSLSGIVGPGSRAWVRGLRQGVTPSGPVTRDRTELFEMRVQRHLSENALQALDRRGREDAARRLLDEVPSLVSLRLEMMQGRTENGSAKHARTIVVDHAPALFEIACIDRSCRNGGHDLTSQIMAALRRSMQTFEGEDTCPGSLGSAECRSVLRYQALALYRDDDK